MRDYDIMAELTERDVAIIGYLRGRRGEVHLAFHDGVGEWIADAESASWFNGMVVGSSGNDYGYH